MPSTQHPRADTAQPARWSRRDPYCLTVERKAASGPDRRRSLRGRDAARAAVPKAYQAGAMDVSGCVVCLKGHVSRDISIVRKGDWVAGWRPDGVRAPALKSILAGKGRARAVPARARPRVRRWDTRGKLQTGQSRCPRLLDNGSTAMPLDGSTRSCRSGASLRRRQLLQRPPATSLPAGPAHRCHCPPPARVAPGGGTDCVRPLWRVHQSECSPRSLLSLCAAPAPARARIEHAPRRPPAHA